ncbi:hypothetical protein EDD21DRAFT_370730 [Dissophora ornata]|nr:hypothetical protein EDD21DRAFT_370730 [Dissophora ornata]
MIAFLFFFPFLLFSHSSNQPTPNNTYNNNNNNNNNNGDSIDNRLAIFKGGDVVPDRACSGFENGLQMVRPLRGGGGENEKKAG